MTLVTALSRDLRPPALAGYAVVLIAPLVLGILLYRLLLMYYRYAERARLNAMNDFVSVVVEFLRYRHRWWALFPTILTLPIAYIVAQLVVPDSAGKPWFVHKYSTFLQTTAGATVALLVVIAVQARVAARQTGFATREAGLVAVLWTLLGEVAALAALSPGLPMDLQRPAFRLMIAGAVSGGLALVFMAALIESEE